MKEHIYTIPVNEAFDNDDGLCPYCHMYKTLEDSELEIILGASMMEPDIRKITNEKGFCREHHAKMFPMKNRLGMALTLESHLDELKKDLKPSVLTADKSARGVARIEKLQNDCYVCDRIEEKLSRMIHTSILLCRDEPEFEKKFKAQKYFCLPHYRRIILVSKQILDKKNYERFSSNALAVVSAYLDTLSEDISWFCKKFDYRYDKEPWNNSKDAVERALHFLNGYTDL